MRLNVLTGRWHCPPYFGNLLVAEMEKDQLPTWRKSMRYQICVAAALTFAMGTAVASDPIPAEASLVDAYPKRDDISF